MIDIKRYRRAKGLTGIGIVGAVKGRFPKYDKYLHCKVERPDEYGICLTPDAERAVMDAFGPDVAAGTRKPATRQLPCSITVRLSRAEMAALQLALKHGETMQGYIRGLIQMDLYDEIQAVCREMVHVKQ